MAAIEQELLTKFRHSLVEGRTTGLEPRSPFRETTSRKVIPLLAEQAILVVSQRIWIFVKKHWKLNCKDCVLPYSIEDCDLLKTEKEKLTLPETTLAAIYIQVYKQWKYECETFSSTGKTELLYLFSWLLKHSEMQIPDFEFSTKDDVFFLMSFGQQLQSLSFDECPWLFTDEIPLIQIVFTQVCNIHSLCLREVTLTENLLEAIGKQCYQLRALKCLELNSDLKPTSFRKLCFRSVGDGAVKNKCCDTLQLIDLGDHFSRGPLRDHNIDESLDRLQLKSNEIALVLINNCPNLKSFGRDFETDTFLKTLKFNAIPNTNMEDIRCHSLTEDVPALLEKFCPHVKKLDIGTADRTVLNQLNRFKSLEHLLFPKVRRPYEQDTVNFLYNEIFDAEFPNLKILHLNWKMKQLNLSVLAEKLPVLQELYCYEIEKVEWDNSTFFQSVNRIRLDFKEQCNATWFAAFRNTIKCIQIFGSHEATVFQKGTFDTLVTDSFPLLKYVSIGRLRFDLNFTISVVTNCQALENLVLYLRDDKRKKVLQLLHDKCINCEVR